MNFQEYLIESQEPSYYVHVTFIKGNEKTDLKKTQEKLTDAFKKLQYDDAPDAVSLVNTYKTEITDTKYYYTMVFELKGASHIIKTPRTNGIIIQTSDSKNEI